VGIYVDQLRRELEDVGIRLIKCEDTSEGEDVRVEGRLFGRDGEITFKRVDQSWRVRGKIPLYIARELYTYPRGSHVCFGEQVLWVDPIECAEPDDAEMTKMGLLQSVMSKAEKCRVALEAGLPLWISSCRIYSQVGLIFFVKLLRERGLINQDQS
jgi:hypothetical protein